MTESDPVLNSELHTPLGQNRPERGAKPAKRRVTAGRVFGVLTATVLIGASFATAFAPQNLSDGNISAMLRQQKAQETAATDTAPTASVAQQAAAPDTGDKPIPDSGMPVRDGQSGGRVETAYNSDGSTVTKISPIERGQDGPVLIRPAETAGQNIRVAHLPEPGMVEETDFGQLPVRSDRGARPMDVYARPWSGARGARIAIVIGGLGLSQTGTLHAIDRLPEEVTLAFASAGNSLMRWMQAARRGGHEILLQVPLEPFNYPQTDPGPNPLVVSASATENLDNLHRAMGRITNYTGIMNHMGGRFMSDAGAMEPVMRDLADRGVLFLDDGSSAQSLAGPLAKATGVPFAAADLVIDRDTKRGAILEKLDELERIARRNGTAIGVGSAFDETVSAVTVWANEAKARGIEIVGVSALAEDPERR